MTHTILRYYFPTGLRYAAPVGMLAALWLLYEGWRVWPVIFLLLGAFILTAKYITEISEHEFVDAFGFFGMKVVDERTKFNRLNKIVISKGNYVQNVNTRFSSRRLDWSDYTGTLVYDDNGSLDLITTDDKDALLNELKVYASSLKVQIEDPNGRVIFSPSSI